MTVKVAYIRRSRRGTDNQQTEHTPLVLTKRYCTTTRYRQLRPVTDSEAQSTSRRLHSVADLPAPTTCRRLRHIRDTTIS